MNDTAFVLVVEDDGTQGEAFCDALREAGFACRLVDNAEDALASMAQRAPDVVVSAHKLSGEKDGLEFLRETKQVSPDTEVILLTADGSEELAREALRPNGECRAFDYLTKPIKPEKLRDKVKQAARHALRSRQNRLLKEQSSKAFEFSGIIGSSEVMHRLIKRLQRIARSKSTILVIGETGTGKELFAQAIHLNSPRAGKPFMVLNCAAVSESLLESELFGHVKGAFTGAIADRKGLIEAADAGTMFLDEIGDMPLTMQAKLLRTLETGEVMRVGTNEVMHFDVRFVAATNRDLGELVREGKFREDLFYRLHAHAALRVPPLRERREDVPVLVQRFIETINRENGTSVEGVSTEVMRKLVNHSWPGNVRELRNVIERMVIEAEGAFLEPEDLPENLRGSTDLVPVGPPDLAGMTMADVEKLHIMNTLRMFGGNRERTAKALGIGARTLYRKLREYGLR